MYRAILFSIFLAFASFLNASSAMAQEQPQEQTVKEGPSIEFEKTTHDYGTIVKGANGDCEFYFKNNGNEPLMLVDVRSSCGCTTPSWTREPIMPGQTGSIKVHYDTNRLGTISKSVTVSTNGDPERLVLRIVGTVVNQITD